MTTNKYPNADTSPERLAEIERSMFGITHVVNSTPRSQFGTGINAAHLQLYDLLAMLQERIPLQVFEEAVQDARAWKKQSKVDKENFDDKLKEWQTECLELRQQLHDQRWRRFDDEKPNEGQKIQVERPSQLARGESTTIVDVQKIQNGDWWRPIPPLPKE